MQRKVSMKITTTRRQTVTLETTATSLVCPVCHHTIQVADILGTTCKECQHLPCVCQATGEVEEQAIASPVSMPSLTLIENPD
jgi:hypothetical protein